MKTELRGVKETLLFTLYFRALDSRSKDPIVGDPWAADVLNRISYRKWKVKMASGDRYLGLMRARKMDDWSRAYLAEYPGATVLHLGCGLDSRAFRLGPPPGVRWFDLDYPEVVELREKLYPQRDNYQTIASSVTDPGWLERVPDDRPVLVIAEGLLMYLKEAAVVRQLLQRITDRFPRGGELIFDSIAPWFGAVGKPFGYHLWPLSDPLELQRWNDRLTFLERVPTIWDVDRIPEAAYRALYRIPSMHNSMHLLRYRLEEHHA